MTVHGEHNFFLASLFLCSVKIDLQCEFLCILQLSGVAPPPLCRNVQLNGSNLNTLGTDSFPKSTVNSTIQAPRRKFVDEGKLRKVLDYLCQNIYLFYSFLYVSLVPTMISDVAS